MVRYNDYNELLEKLLQKTHILDGNIIYSIAGEFILQEDLNKFSNKSLENSIENNKKHNTIPAQNSNVCCLGTKSEEPLNKFIDIKKIFHYLYYIDASKFINNQQYRQEIIKFMIQELINIIDNDDKLSDLTKSIEDIFKKLKERENFKDVERELYKKIFGQYKGTIIINKSLVKKAIENNIENLNNQDYIREFIKNVKLNENTITDKGYFLFKINNIFESDIQNILYPFLKIAIDYNIELNITTEKEKSVANQVYKTNSSFFRVVRGICDQKGIIINGFDSLYPDFTKTFLEELVHITFMNVFHNIQANPYKYKDNNTEKNDDKNAFSTFNNLILESQKYRLSLSKIYQIKENDNIDHDLDYSLWGYVRGFFNSTVNKPEAINSEIKSEEIKNNWNDIYTNIKDRITNKMEIFGNFINDKDIEDYIQSIIMNEYAIVLGQDLNNNDKFYKLKIREATKDLFNISNKNYKDKFYQVEIKWSLTAEQLLKIYMHRIKEILNPSLLGYIDIQIQPETAAKLFVFNMENCRILPPRDGSIISPITKFFVPSMVKWIEDTYSHVAKKASKENILQGKFVEKVNNEELKKKNKEKNLSYINYSEESRNYGIV